jgi:hypothetical protein
LHPTLVFTEKGATTDKDKIMLAQTWSKTAVGDGPSHHDVLEVEIR